MFEGLEKFAQRCCLIDAAGQSWSYGEILAKANTATDQLAGDKKLVFLAGGNTVGLIAAYLGAMRGGHAVHLLDPTKTKENARLLALYEPNALITAGKDDFTTEIRNSDKIALHPDLAVLLSTSGSTGTSKFVKLSEGNVAANTASIIEYLGLTPDDRAITTLKPFYSYGFSVVNTHLSIGASLLLSELSVQEPEFWMALQTHEATNLPGVPHTFQTIHAQNIALEGYPSLRFMTQAGGKLGANLVTHFAEAGAQHGFAFFVMYGQTEAAPRISYLPPEMALSHPGSIGRAVPGGRLWLVDAAGQEIDASRVEGQLAYTGPNVMMGYASEPSALATTEPPDALMTGDLAIRNTAGLFEITGRSARIVKPFGLRISLDEIEAITSDQFGAAVAIGHEDSVRVFLEGRADPVEVQTALSTRTGLPAPTFEVNIEAAIPRLASGKPDYRSLSERPMAAGAPAPGFGGFLRDAAREFTAILTGRQLRPASVIEAFENVFVLQEIDLQSSFRTLGGDSLMMLQLYLLLEEYLDEIPDSWQSMTVADLEKSSAARGF